MKEWVHMLNRVHGFISAGLDEPPMRLAPALVGLIIPPGYGNASPKVNFFDFFCFLFVRARKQRRF